MTKIPKPLIGAAYDSLRVVMDRVGSDKAKFMSDSILQDATLMRLMDAGEQLARVRETFPDFFNDHASESWHRIIGLRNIIAHGYLTIDYEIIWSIIQKYLPELTSELEKLS
jgi:uncharacterized protein with HEPN domain